jgi:hypothetical protein
MQVPHLPFLATPLNRVGANSDASATYIGILFANEGDSVDSSIRLQTFSNHHGRTDDADMIAKF